MELGNIVKKRREELGLSQEQLALRMGYSSRTSINKIENGRPCSQKIIARLSEVLNISIPCLMGWDEEQKEKPNIPEDDGLTEAQRNAIALVKKMDEQTLTRFVAAAKAMLGED